ncbi:hypothetical protein D9615_006386 [Tricholomella constricta]|uniref:Uncharacterized protein n=1 Tax=Tricholomella constricta TaxID=117010 RepID=A0A8H5H659_9AGAR|nr:hypothetical protein D9615_006386 [Tricholomella constricta]
MAPKPRQRKSSISVVGKDAPVATRNPPKSLMLPPPDPQVPRGILEPEMTALSNCLKNATVKTGQIYRFFADTHKLGIENHVPNPPRSLSASLGREVEKYDQLVDAMESHLLRAIAVLQRDLHREEKRIKLAQEAAVATRTRSKSASLSPTSTRVALPPVAESFGGEIASQSIPSAPLPTPTNSPPAPPSAGPGRRPSAISISSLHRPAFPLKLDLSSTALRITPEEASMFSSGLASPVTLAPKSARAIGPNEFPPDLMAAFASSSQSIDLTLETDNADVKMTMENVGTTADKPIELDLEGMDIDMAMTDIFGDTADTGSNDANATMDGLFSPIVVESDVSEVNDTSKPDKTHTPFLETLGQATSGDDIFSSLDVPDDPNQHQQLKDASSSIRSAPSPASLLASFESSSQLQTINSMSSSNMSVPDTSFDISSLDLSNLSPSFFGGASETDINFSMDMDQFLATVNEGKQDGEGKKEDAT